GGSAPAARGSQADAWVVAPVVATAQEAAAFADRARAHGLSRVGVMVEVPAAALAADRVVAAVDFVSIGTNDLSQYTFAADRQAGALAPLLDPWQPALLRLGELTAPPRRPAGKPVGVCGPAPPHPPPAPRPAPP